MKLEDYTFEEAEAILTPALAVYADKVDANIEAALRMMDGDANRWRPHLKTAKMRWVIERLLHDGVRQFKCATTRELAMACESGAPDVLVAFPLTGPHARRVMEIAEEHPGTRVSVLVENAAQAALWRGSDIGIFIDVNPGMDRTGVGQEDASGIIALAQSAGTHFRGIHYYDGHVTAPSMSDRERLAYAGYDRLMGLVAKLTDAGLRVGEVITAGTPAMPCSLSYAGFTSGAFVHRVSPGTIVFNDVNSLAQLPGYGFQAAALVIATVVSHPAPGRVTCDAGHKSVSADAGVPTCVVVGHRDFEPLKPSEEHLPIAVGAHDAPAIGELLYLLPKHICPSVNLFDEALLIRDRRVTRIEPVAARGHERALTLV
jgi:D-serine deaminase-like pyridoxal phosphate-dependent protein